MSGCHTRQIASRKTIICLLLLISIQTIADAASKMSLNEMKNQQHNLSPNKSADLNRISRSDVHVRRLYDAYKDRVKEETDETDNEIASNGENKVSPSVIGVRPKSKTKRLHHKHADCIQPSIDATDEKQNEADMRASVAKAKHVEKAHSDRAKVDAERPAIDNMVLVKLDTPKKKDTEPLTHDMETGKEKALVQPLTEAEHKPNAARLAELNRIYNDYAKQYHKTIEEDKHISEDASTEKDKPAQQAPKSARSDVLNQLVNIIERMGGSSKDSYDSMTKLSTDTLRDNKRPPIASGHAVQVDDLVNEAAQATSESLAELSGKKQEEFNSLFQKIQPASTSNLFERVAKEMLVARTKVKAGGMYDEYKKRLYTMLSKQGNAKDATQAGITSENDFPIDSENERKAKDVALCKCDSPDAADRTLALTKALSRDKVENKDQCQQAALNGYLNALEFIANNTGGPNPYYLPNSKQRQLVWNEVPMLKKGGGTPPGKAQKILANKNASGKPKHQTSSEADGNGGVIGPKFKSKISRPATEDAKKPYEGVNPKQIKAAVDAFQQASFSSLYDEYLKQLQNLNQMLKEKHRWWIEAQGKMQSATSVADSDRSSIGTATDNAERADAQVETSGGSEGTPADSPVHNNNIQQLASLEGDLGHINAANSAYPNVLTQSYGVIHNPNMIAQSAGSGLLENMASQLNLSPVELAQRITSSSHVDDGHSLHNDQGLAINSVPISASPTSTVQLPIVSVVPVANATAKLVETGPQVMMHAAPVSPNLMPILDKILQRLQSMQESKQSSIDDDDIQSTVAATVADKKLPCCFANPTDGAPCDITGSWESMLLGIRINIASPQSQTVKEVKMTCQMPKKRSPTIERNWRQCVKINSKQLKELSDTQTSGGAFQYLNVSVQETVPPRSHELIDNIGNWVFNGYSVNTLGGPITLSCRKMGSSLIGTFIGYCRTCGCVDTIFGSWSFCLPSRDCQDITTSIFDRRDLLRRYNMDNKRRDRFKESLYNKSNFAKIEKHRQHAEHPSTGKHV